MPSDSQLIHPVATPAVGGLPRDLGKSLPELADPLARLFCRLGVAWGRRRVIAFEGAEHLAPERDPFVLVANHSQRSEALLLPMLAAAFRRGRLVHFMADWPMMLVPGVAVIYRRGQVIPVFAKSPRFPLLGRLKPLFQERFPGSAQERAGALLEAGRSVGIFPEGTMNRDPERLLRGRLSAARLAVDHGVRVVPVGLSFPTVEGRPIADDDPFVVRVGEPLSAPRPELAGRAERERAVRHVHGRIMGAVADLCGKSWSPGHSRRRPSKEL